LEISGVEMNETEMVFQINGKTAKRLGVLRDMSQQKLEELALKVLNVKAAEVKKFVIIPNKLINVIKEI
jgi:leucyl-tRNA synthetase